MTAQEVFRRLLGEVEAKTEENGVVWGQVYLPNVGDGRSFAGCLSQLKQDGKYRPVSKDFGEVRMP